LKNILEVIKPASKIILREIIVWIRLFKLKRDFFIRNRYVGYIWYLLNSLPLDILVLLIIILVSVITVSITISWG
jgi:hypothetical protein